MVTWSAALVAVVRKDEASIGAKPGKIVQRMVAFGWAVTTDVLRVSGEAGLGSPAAQATLLLVKQWLARRRKNPSAKGLARLVAEASRPEATAGALIGWVIGQRPLPAELVEGAATYLAAAAITEDVDRAEVLVAGAIERVTRVTSREEVSKAVMAGMAAAGHAMPPRKPPSPRRGRRR